MLNLAMSVVATRGGPLCCNVVEWPRAVVPNYIPFHHPLTLIYLLSPFLFPLPFFFLAGFRIRWLVESYLGLKHIPFEHFACSRGCARRLNISFQKIQSKLKQQHDQAYQTMLERYADTETAGQARHGSFLRKKRKELEVREMWRTDFGPWSTGGRRQTWTTGHQTATMYHSHSQHHTYHHHHHSRGRGRGTSCSVM